MGIFFPHLIFQLPSRFFGTIMGPLYLYLSNGPVPRHLGSFVQYAYGLNMNFPFGFYLYHKLIKSMIRIIHIFL